MKKVIFCEVAWMKYYNGVTEDDKPMNGGKYIDENGDGGEVYNFAPYNHKCYGYVMFYGQQLHIERYDKTPDNHSEVTDMTVVWVASDGKSRKIVGWYEHATVHRFGFHIDDPVFFNGIYFDRHFVAKETDCYLIEESKRTYAIPSAPQAGKGRGMGQSQVWYADTQYAQEEVVPNVLKYLDRVRDSCKPFYITTQELHARAGDQGLSIEQLEEKTDQALDAGDARIAIALANLLIDKDDSFASRLARAIVFERIGFYDEAEEDWKKALYESENIVALEHLMYVEMMLENNYLAIELGERIRKRKEEDPDWWPVAADYLAYTYIIENQLDKAQDLICECEEEPDAGRHDWIEGMKEWIETLLEEENRKK